MKNINSKYFLYLCCLALFLVTGCNTDETSTQNTELKLKEKGLLVFHARGEFEWNKKKMRLGGPVSEWLIALGPTSRIMDNNLYMWDEKGIKLFTKRKSSDANPMSPNDVVSSVAIHFVDWDKYDPYLGGGEGLPTGYFKGVFQYGDATIDRDTSVKEFLSHKSTARFVNSYSRSNYYRELVSKTPPIEVGVYIRGGDKSPWLPKSISIF